MPVTSTTSAAPFSDQTLVSRLGSLLEQELDGEIIALSVEQGLCFGFNATASRVWALLEQPRSVGEIRDILMSEFSVDPETCQRELRALLEQLAADRLVKLGRPAAS